MAMRWEEGWRDGLTSRSWSRSPMTWREVLRMAMSHGVGLEGVWDSPGGSQTPIALVEGDDVAVGAQLGSK